MDFDLAITRSLLQNVKKFVCEEIWEEGESEEEYEPVEVTIDDEVIRVAVPGNSILVHDHSVNETKKTAVVGPEIVRPFSLNFRFSLPKDTELKKLSQLPTKDIMRELGNIVGITDVTRNKYSYWLTDVMLESFLNTQNQEMAEINRVNTLNWFLFVVQQIQLTSLSRRDFFLSLEKLMLAAEKVMINTGSEVIPNPAEVFDVKEVCVVFGRNKQLQDTEKGGEQAKRLSSVKQLENMDVIEATLPSVTERSGRSPPGGQTLIQIEEKYYGEPFYFGPPPITENSLLTMAESLYDIFANHLAYEILRDVFWEEPLVEVICISEKIVAPKILANDEVESPTEYITVWEDSNVPTLKPNGACSFSNASEKRLTIDKLFEDQEKEYGLRNADLQRLKDRYLLPLADAIDSNYFRTIYPDINGISKFLFVKRRNMNDFRAAVMVDNSGQKKLFSHRKSRASKRQMSTRRASKKRKSSVGRRSSSRSVLKNPKPNAQRKSL